MELVNEALGALSGYAWGLPFIFVLVAVGGYFTFRLGFVSIRRFGHAVGIGMGRYDRADDPGEITHFQALCAALSATVGTGNIAGVATAIHAGGPGALFWMWVFGFFGMATKYATCSLSLRYRRRLDDGSYIGGPMEYIEHGLGPRFKWLAVAFAISAAVASFGGGNMVQANSMAGAFSDEFGPHLPAALTGSLSLLPGHETTPLKLILGIAIAAVVGLVIIGGIRRIGAVASKLVPFMAVFYVGGAILILLFNLDRLPGAFGSILVHAFSDTPRAAGGGALGITVLTTLTWGAKRAIFSNEAGLGSAPIAHAAAKTKEPIREGLVAMLGPFVDTIVVCTMTGLVIVLSGLWDGDLDAEVLTKTAFAAGLPESAAWFGGLVVAVGLILFAVSTAISWSYYGDRCVSYLFGSRAVRPYRWIFVGFLVVGANVRLEVAWNFADFTMALMAFWNLIGVVGLSGVVLAMTREYFGRTHEPVPKDLR